MPRAAHRAAEVPNAAGRHRYAASSVGRRRAAPCGLSGTLPNTCQTWAFGPLARSLVLTMTYVKDQYAGNKMAEHEPSRRRNFLQPIGPAAHTQRRMRVQHGAGFRRLSRGIDTKRRGHREA